ncbi:hypothetical protein pclt_cds_732 [Pandoravirus celtis]|uniref:Uncharacterized protein n=1 Tax=Pandoravirus celtis TaxID=2568002 RepID=A0A4D6EII2_9VIRU|nr:hypothetical protein pclt_cds_732 [Pandoravirus celtis]
MAEHAGEPALTTLWHRMAVLTRDPSAATDDEKQWLAVLACDAGLKAANDTLTDALLAATLQAHMPLWETMVNAQPALPWVGVGVGSFPHPLAVLRELGLRGHKTHARPRDMDFETRLFDAVKMIQDAVAREPPMWPLDFGSRPDAAGQSAKMCAIVVATMSPQCHFFMMVAPFDSPVDDQPNAAVYLDIPAAPGTTACMNSNLLGRALAERHHDNPLFSDEARVGRALGSDRLRPLGTLVVEAIDRGAPEIMGLRPASPKKFVKCLLGIARRPAIAATAFWLAMCTRIHVAYLTTRDLINVLDASMPCVDRAREALAQPTLRNTAAIAVARNPALCLGDHTLKALDRESAALVAAHLFQRHPERVVGDNDLLQRIADVLGVSDDHAPLGSDQHRGHLCRAIALAIMRHHGSES